MKKTIILCLILLIISGCSSKEEKIKVPEEKIKVETKTLDISEKGTEINFEITNTSNKVIKFSEIKAELYDSASKKVAVISKKINKEIMPSKTETIYLNSKEKYPSTSELKYIVYS